MAKLGYSVIGVLGISTLLMLTGCFGPPAQAPTNTSAAPTTSASPTASTSKTASPTPTATISTPAASPSSAPAGPPATAEPTTPAFPEQVAPLTVYYVAVGDNGVSGSPIGCGDSIVATTTAPVRFTDQVGPSVGTLLANKSRDVGLSGLMNALYQSDLTYAGGELSGSTITIWLTGQFVLAGVCDIPRVKAQLEYTAMAASGATSARVLVNGRPIEEVLSLK
ncbi:hypothetical protein [Paenarthrobacter aromaticivorans]|uniref:GerMN domain-containing protein n=1 Tax=Paenarthrobacter aromaticivorans TaxID=2849150 RepID=A0ABS6I556_9MICC|nr:hypothetical protein [Paenarthrobacter sp. MMS21-TAE1-1]MBU8865866.1 hypothetical protein [Paenarthrobacter sp. MMS21-TAE1-1]